VVYGSRPYEVFGDSTVLYTRNQANVYATLLNWNGGSITLKSLRSGGATLGNISKVELLGSDVSFSFVQNNKGLTLTPKDTVPPLIGIADQSLASKCRVFRITHDKGWFNDDDPGVKAPGWLRKCNLESGDFNNDLTTSSTPGDVWSCSVTGTSFALVAPKEVGAGCIDIQIDGSRSTMIDLSTTGSRKAQQVVFEAKDLVFGKHTINIINRGSGPVAIDAIIVR